VSRKITVLAQIHHFNEMGGARSAYGGREEAYIGFWWGNLMERDHLEVPGLDGRIILDGSSGSGMWGCGLDRAG